MEENQTKIIVIFTINGINSLLGWNAVLASLDYFAAAFSDFNIYSFLPVPLFAGYLTVGSTYHILSNRFAYSGLIKWGNSIVSLAMLGMLGISLALQNTKGGFAMLLLSSYFIGIGANLSQLSFFAMINYLSQNVVSMFTVGTALSGLFITILRVIIVAITGTDNSRIGPILTYFIIAILFNTFDLFLNISFCKSKVYKQKIDKFLIHHDNQNLDKVLTQTQYTPQKINHDGNQQKKEADQVQASYIAEEQRIQGQNYFITLLETGKAIFPIPIFLALNYMITFTLFPGPTFSKTFDDINTSWSILIFLLAYNIGDTTGKYAADLKGAFNATSFYYLLLARLFFFFTITIMANGADKDDPMISNVIFPFINQLLFGFTNGFITNCSFILSFTVCPLIYKKYAGVLCGLALQIGIMVGTVLEIPYAYLIGIS